MPLQNAHALSQFQLAILNILYFLLQHLSRVVLVFIASGYFLLEFLHVDLYVPFDLLRFCFEHVPQLGTLVLESQNRQRVLRDIFIYFQDLGIDFF